MVALMGELFEQDSRRHPPTQDDLQIIYFPTLCTSSAAGCCLCPQGAEARVCQGRTLPTLTALQVGSPMALGPSWETFNTWLQSMSLFSAAALAGTLCWLSEVRWVMFGRGGLNMGLQQGPGPASVSPHLLQPVRQGDNIAGSMMGRNVQKVGCRWEESLYGFGYYKFSKRLMPCQASRRLLQTCDGLGGVEASPSEELVKLGGGGVAQKQQPLLSQMQIGRVLESSLSQDKVTPWVPCLKQS